MQKALLNAAAAMDTAWESLELDSCEAALVLAVLAFVKGCLAGPAQPTPVSVVALRQVSTFGCCQ